MNINNNVNINNSNAPKNKSKNLISDKIKRMIEKYKNKVANENGGYCILSEEANNMIKSYSKNKNLNKLENA